MGRIISLREVGFSIVLYYLVCSGTVPQYCKFGSSGPTSIEQIEKLEVGRWKGTSAHDDRHLLRMTVNDYTASSRQLAALVSSIRRSLLHRGLCARVPLYLILFSANHRQLCLHWAHEHRAWQANWHQVVFSDESCFDLWDHDGCIRLRCYAGERYLPECIIVRHSGQNPELWFGVRFHITVNPIFYELRVILVATGTSGKCYSPKSFPSFKASLDLSFSRIMHAYLLQRLFEISVQSNACDFFLGPAYSLDRSRLLSTCGIWLIGAFLVIRVLQLQKTNFCCACKLQGISSTSRHSKSV
ncbi:transposable element Tcb1 transposase [Trichonephila clavipes]|nr:transposable element Tcb1 transposase [Trichonephila clavipes]